MLNTGQILIAGGINCASTSACTYLNSAEIYSQTTSAFANTAGMAQTRSAPGVLLNNGNVLIAGGYTCDTSGNCSSLGSAEIYNPTVGTFTSAGNMTVARSGQTMTVLGNGSVLIAGGQTCTSATSCTALASVEIYDPIAATFTASSNSMSAARFGASAVALNSGSVLIAGGFDGTNLPAQAEIYNPAQNGFTGNGAQLNTPRFYATATLLNNGQVLVAGGSTCNLPGCPTNAAEIYDPVANAFTVVAGGMNVSRFSHTATLLTNGLVLLAGGFSSCGTSPCTSESSAEVFDPVAGLFSLSQSVPNALAGQTATLTANGSALLIGGINAGVTLSGDEWYQPTNFTPPNLSSVAVAPSTLSLMPGQTQQLVAIGTFNDGSTQTLQSVIWNSSNTAAAVISNSPGSAGVLNAQATGTTTVTATAGDIGGSASVHVAGLVSLSVTPANPTIVIGAPQQISAIGTFTDGSTQNVSTSAIWTSSNSSVVIIGTMAGFQGLAIGATAGTSTITATYGGFSASTPINVQNPVAPNPPNIISVSPPGGEGGTQVTISGTGFGATEGSGTVWLGSTYAAVVNWSDTQIVAVVAAISQSGMAQVQQAGLFSNAVSFSVNTATISNVYPAIGVPGTQVTVSGSGFGATRGSGQVWLGTASGAVQSWSDGQIIAEVAAGATSGMARVLQDGVLSNAVPFTVNLPYISGISPSSGTAGTVVTIYGSGFGGGTSCGGGGGGGGSDARNGQRFNSVRGQTSIPNNSYLWISGVNAAVTSWCDTKIVASVPSGAVTGVVNVDAIGTWSNNFSFIVSESNDPISLVPNTINFNVGQSQTAQALDANNQPATGLTWTSSNANVVSLSNADPPTLTAAGQGTATITAGGASMIVTVYPPGVTPAPGTTLWSDPVDNGVLSIVPAVPSLSGVADVFALDGQCNILAVASNGTVPWTANIGRPPQYPYYAVQPGPCNTFLPDFQGGLVVESQKGFTQPDGQVYFQNYLQKFDGLTGQPYPAFTLINTSAITFSDAPQGAYPPAAVSTDGTIFTVDGGYLVAINPITGQPTFSISTAGVVDPGDLAPPYIFPFFPPTTGNVLVAGDGYAYMPEAGYASTAVGPPVDPCGPGIETTTLYLMRLNSAGKGNTITLGQWSTPVANCTTYTETSVGGVNLITNADQGTLATWALQTISANNSSSYSTSNTYYIATTSGINVTSQNTPNQLTPLLQRADGNFVGTVSPPPGAISTSSNGSMAVFTPSGSILSSLPGDYPQIATPTNGVIGIGGTAYDSQLNVTGQVALPIQSWLGNGYVFPLQQVAFPTILPATPPYWSFSNTYQPPNPIWSTFYSGANQSGNGTSPLCHDDRDQFTPEYVTYGAGFVPTCFVFLSSATYASAYPAISQNFPFSILNQDDINPKYNDHPLWAILASSMLNGIQNIQSTYGQITITSGYRSPLVQHAVSPKYPHDRHIHGDAVDMATGSAQIVWNTLHSSALAAGACVEPEAQSTVNHVHADWRGACPAGWRN
jgi:hypothetical protein